MTRRKPAEARRPATATEERLAAMAEEHGVPIEAVTIPRTPTGIRLLAAAMREALPSGATGRQEEWDAIAGRTLGTLAALQERQAALEEQADEDEEERTDGTNTDDA
jgi:hypothetical protein